MVSHIYLQRRRRRWYAVVEIPKSLQGHFGRKRFIKSLGTESLTEAERLRWPVVSQWQAEIARASREDADPLSDLDATAAEWRADFLGSRGEEREVLSEVLGDFVTEIAWKDEAKATEFHAVVTGKAVPLGEHINAWLRPSKNAQKTIDMQRRDATRFAERFRFADRVTSKAVQRWTFELQEEERLIPATVRRMISACRMYWKYLKRSGVIDSDADPFVDAVERRAKRTKADVESDRRAFSAEDLVKLLRAAVAKRDRPLAQLIWLGMWTGCRIEELCALRATEVYSDHLLISDAKSEAGNRLVPIHSRADELIRHLLAERSDGYVFSGLTFNKYGDRSNAIGKRFGRMKSAMGFTESHVFHSIRKTVTTLLENAGVPESVAADILGHEKPTITYGLYSAGTSLAVRREAIEKLSYPIEAAPPFLLQSARR